MSNVRVAALLLSVALAGSAEEKLRVGATFTESGAISVQLVSVLPPGTCVTLAIGFEGEPCPGGQVAVYLHEDGSASQAVGPFPGMALLHGSYEVVATVDPENQDASVLPYFKASPAPVSARASTDLGAKEQIDADRATTAEYLVQLVAACRGKAREGRAALDELRAGKRFATSGGSGTTLDKGAWDGFVGELIRWTAGADATHQEQLARVLGPHYPQLMRFTAVNLLGGLALLAREYGCSGYANYKLKPPPELATRAVIKPDLATMEMMLDRDCRTILQTLGKESLRPLSDVLVKSEGLPEGLHAAAAVPEDRADVFGSNPATLDAEGIAKGERWKELAPRLDLTGAQGLYWFAVETSDEPRRSVEVWIVSYDTPARRAAALGRLSEGMAKPPAEDAFGGEQFLCWVRADGEINLELHQLLMQSCHRALGW